MDSDFKRPKQSNKDSLDTHIPHKDTYESRSNQTVVVGPAGSGDIKRTVMDIKPPTPTTETPKSANSPTNISEFDSPAPLAAPTKPVRTRMVGRRLPRVRSMRIHNDTGDTADNNGHVGGIVGGKIDQVASDKQINSKRSSKGRALRWILGIVSVLLVILAAISFFTYSWYSDNIKAVEPNSSESVRVTIPEGSNRAKIASILNDAGLIRSVEAFNWYYRLNAGDGMKAGVYMFEKNMNVADIVARLESGEVDEFTLTFLPGGTIFDAKDVMLKAGYQEEEVDSALYAQYDTPIMKDRPAGSSIEGYIYGETYNFASGSSAKDVFDRTIQELAKYMEVNNTEAKFAQMGFNIHQGLTFASLVQPEVGNSGEMKQVSSVFHNRLKVDMELGSDVTFRYAARMLDEPVAIEIDSPYNTRIYKGLPPGPVAAPGASAIYATGLPDGTDYLFFVSGDDGVTYFSRTNEEHERLPAEHCDLNCRVQM